MYFPTYNELTSTPVPQWQFLEALSIMHDGNPISYPRNFDEAAFLTSPIGGHAVLVPTARTIEFSRVWMAQYFEDECVEWLGYVRSLIIARRYKNKLGDFIFPSMNGNENIILNVLIDLGYAAHIRDGRLEVFI